MSLSSWTCGSIKEVKLGKFLPPRCLCITLIPRIVSPIIQPLWKPLSTYPCHLFLSYDPLLAFLRWKITGQPVPLCSPHLCWPLTKLCHPIWDHLTPLWSVVWPGSNPSAYPIHSCSIPVPLTEVTHIFFVLSYISCLVGFKWHQPFLFTQ